MRSPSPARVGGGSDLTDVPTTFTFGSGGIFERNFAMQRRARLVRAAARSSFASVTVGMTVTSETASR